MWSGARTERTMRAVHEQNLKYAEEAGMTIDEWHKMMSEKGKGVQPILVKKKYVPQTATEQVLHQLFPTVHKD